MRDLREWENMRDKIEVEGRYTQGTVKRPAVKQATRLKRIFAYAQRREGTAPRGPSQQKLPSLPPTWGSLK